EQDVRSKLRFTSYAARESAKQNRKKKKEAVRSALAAALTQQPEAKPPVTVLTGYQLRAALNFLAPDRGDEQLSTEVAIQWGPAREDDEGRDEAGLYCWCVECPEEGSVRLDETPTPGRDGLQHEPGQQPEARGVVDEAPPRYVCLKAEGS